MEAERRNSTARDAGEKKGAFWAEKIMTSDCNVNEKKANVVELHVFPHILCSNKIHTVLEDLGIKIASTGPYEFGAFFQLPAILRIMYT